MCICPSCKPTLTFPGLTRASDVSLVWVTWQRLQLCATALSFPPPTPTRCLQVCLSNVIYSSGIPLVPAQHLVTVSFILWCHGLTLIHWPSSLMHYRTCNFTFHCALPQWACANLLYSTLITNLAWNALIRFVFHTPNVNLIENFSFSEDLSISRKL